MRVLPLLLGSVIAASVAACGPSPVNPKRQIGPHPYLPAIHNYLLPPMHLATIGKWGNATPTVPSDMQIKALATGLHNPRSVYALPNGDILVAEPEGATAPAEKRPKEFIMNWMEAQTHSATKGANDILLFRINADGTPVMKSVFISHLNAPFGMVLVGNDFYVADTDAVLRFPYHIGETEITTPGVRLTELPAGPINHHWTKSLTASPDGTKLYVSIGSNSNITENGIQAEIGRADIWEIDRATGAHREYATGLRNPNGLKFEPSTHVLYAVVNERDEIGPDLVPDYLTSVKDHGFYGWPYSYWGKHLDPRVQPQRPDLVANAIEPDYALSSHVAPLGMVFDTGKGLPARYRGSAFIAEHGSWDRSVMNGYKVVFVPFSNGRPSGMAEDVVTGFLDGETAHGRPVDVALDARGALLIADDTGNTVWRVTAR